jgi:hypothetical protein
MRIECQWYGRSRSRHRINRRNVFDAPRCTPSAGGAPILWHQSNGDPRTRPFSTAGSLPSQRMPDVLGVVSVMKSKYVPHQFSRVEAPGELVRGF